MKKTLRSLTTKPNRMVGTAILSLVGLTSAAFGQLVVYEGFSDTGYTAGANLDGLNGGTGFTSAWSQFDSTSNKIGAGSLSYQTGLNQLITNGNRGAFISSASQYGDAARNLPSLGSIDDTTVWMSVLARVDAGGDWYGGFGLNPFSGGGKLEVNVDASGFWQFSNSSTSVATTASRAIGVTTFFVMRIDIVSGLDTATLFVNPTLGVVPTTGGFSLTENLNTLTRLRAFQPEGTTIALDEFRFGSTYSDVTPFTVVPEPSTSALLIGASCLVMVQRRRRQTV